MNIHHASVENPPAGQCFRLDASKLSGGLLRVAAALLVMSLVALGRYQLMNSPVVSKGTWPLSASAEIIDAEDEVCRDDSIAPWVFVNIVITHLKPGEV